MSQAGENSVAVHSHSKRWRREAAFTLTELMVSIAIIAILLSILIPALGKAKSQARALLNASRQRNVLFTIETFSQDNRDRYPPSVATVGMGSNWRWQDPRLLIGFDQRSPQLRRSMSGYLGAYVESTENFHCPSTPNQYTHLEKAWAAGDQWDHPSTPLPFDPLVGTFNIFWNYTGHLPAYDGPFIGPEGPSASSHQSKLVMTDYIGFGHWSNPDAYSSCEQVKGAVSKPETWVAASCWSSEPQDNAINHTIPQVTLRAGFTDGHVESYNESELTILNVAEDKDGANPFPRLAGAGDIFIPRRALE